MRKRILVAVVAATVLGGGAIAVAESSDSRSPSATAAGPKPVQKELAAINRRLSQATASRVSCRSVACINRNLTTLARDVRLLKRDAFVCERLVNATQYNGYDYSPDGGATFFLTTALDYTEPGDPVSDRVVVYTC
jgi:hypothetical protein